MEPLFASSAITRLLTRQRWPWSSVVDIDVYFDSDKNADVSFQATFDGQTTPITLEMDGATEFQITPGFSSFVWDPVAAGLGENPLKGFTVTAVLATFDARKYFVIDMKERSWAFYADDPDGNNWADNKYKSRYIVFRRVPAGTYQLGITTDMFNYLYSIGAGGIGSIHPQIKKARTIRLTSDYYIAIYQLTASQLTAISAVKVLGSGGITYEGKTFWWPEAHMTSYASATMCPYKWRGDPTNQADRCAWPQDGHKVAMIPEGQWGDPSKSMGSAVGQLRDLMTLTPHKLPANMTIDLPTQEQWEIASRGGCSTMLADNVGAIGDSRFDMLTYKTNHFVIAGGAAVGTKAPNNWGIYDALGLVYELTLNTVNPDHKATGAEEIKPATTYAQFITFDETQTVDPVGWTCPTDGSVPLYMVACNTGWSNGGIGFESFAMTRTGYLPYLSNSAVLGGRLAIHLDLK